MPDVLLVAATERELCGRNGLVCGVGPVEAAAATAHTLAQRDVGAVLHIGIAGARGASGIAAGDVVVGARALYEDFGVSGFNTPRAVDADPALAVAAASVVGGAPITIGTTARVGGTSECAVEAMEGFAVLRACQLAGVPAVEVRAISNLIEDVRAAWRIDEALEALAAVVPALLDALATATRP